MGKIFETYSENTLGRDFICADIHGYFDLLESELESVNFDTDVDRLFSLGDLIDRGEDSYSALKWLNYSWFHAVMGNHESVFMQSIEARNENLKAFDSWHQFPGGWKKDLSVDQLMELYSVFCELPVVIEVQLSNKQKIGLCHAQFPKKCDWEILKINLENENYDYLSEIYNDLVWGSGQLAYASLGIGHLEPVKNIDRVFHGHHIVNEVKTLANRTFMDLGSYSNGKIGFLEPAKFLKKESKVA